MDGEWQLNRTPSINQANRQGKRAVAVGDEMVIMMDSSIHVR